MKTCTLQRFHAIANRGKHSQIVIITPIDSPACGSCCKICNSCIALQISCLMAFLVWRDSRLTNAFLTDFVDNVC